MTPNDIPGPGDQCVCGSYYGCRCPPEPDVDAYYDASYEAGHEACLADGYDERPMTEWVVRTHHRARWCGADRRVVFSMTGARFVELTWRHRHRSAAAYAVWFERQYGHDLGAYLEGFDDAGAGLPSAVADPDAHRAAAAALDALRPVPGAAPALPPVEADDGLPF